MRARVSVCVRVWVGVRVCVYKGHCVIGLIEAKAICTETLLSVDGRIMAERLLGGLWVNVPTALVIVCPLCLVTTWRRTSGVSVAL